MECVRVLDLLKYDFSFFVTAKFNALILRYALPPPFQIQTPLRPWGATRGHVDKFQGRLTLEPCFFAAGCVDGKT